MGVTVALQVAGKPVKRRRVPKGWPAESQVPPVYQSSPGQHGLSLANLQDLGEET